MRRYVFSELVPIDELLAGETLALLAERSIAVYVAITPPARRRAVEIVTRCRDAGLRVGAWPMIADADGRWASAWNGEAFAGYCRDLVDELDTDGALPDELLIDLEPPIDLTRRLLSGRPELRGPPPRRGARALRTLVDELAGRGDVDVTAAVHPWTAAGPGGRGWQRAFGTPLTGMPLARVFVMAYTSLLEGYSRGLIRRADAESLLITWTRQSAAVLGETAAVALGTTGIGALGDERCYRSPDELARDVALARAAGVDQLALFSLGGALRRSTPARWLDAFADTEAAPTLPSPTLRARLGSIAADFTGRGLDRLLRTRPIRRE